MTLTLKELVLKYPYLNERWIRERANEGLIPHSRPHYRLYIFEEDKFEKALLSLSPVSNSNLDQQVAREYFKKKP